MQVIDKRGCFELIYGCMFSGKTEELIYRVHNALGFKKKVVVFKPTIDNRYSNNEVVSHKGTSIISFPINHSTEIYHYIKNDVDVIAIDEIQFLDDEIVNVIKHLVKTGYRVIAAGLDLDFRGEPFGKTLELKEEADIITNLHANCSVCGSPACRTQRLIKGHPAHCNDSIIIVGSFKEYEPRCLLHHEVSKEKK